jgi:hypothetical protein
VEVSVALEHGMGRQARQEYLVLSHRFLKEKILHKLNNPIFSSLLIKTRIFANLKGCQIFGFKLLLHLVEFLLEINILSLGMHALIKILQTLR